MTNVIEGHFGPQTTPAQMHQIQATLSKWGEHGRCPFDGLYLEDAVALCMAALKGFYADTVDEPYTKQQIALALIKEAQDVLNEPEISGQ